MSEKTAELPIRSEAANYVSDVNKLIRNLEPRPLEDFLNMQANTGLLESYKSRKEQLFNMKEPRNIDGKYLNANERRVIEVAYNKLHKLVDKDREGAALSAEMARASPYVISDEEEHKLYGDPENEGHKQGWTPAIRVSQKHAKDFEIEKRAAKTKRDLPPPPYTPRDPNPKHKGGKRKTRRRRKLKKRKTMKKKRLRRKKTMKKRKSRKRRKTKKRRSKRR